MKIWAGILKYSVGLATLLVLAVCGLAMLIAIGVAVALAELVTIIE